MTAQGARNTGGAKAGTGAGAAAGEGAEDSGEDDTDNHNISAQSLRSSRPPIVSTLYQVFLPVSIYTCVSESLYMLFEGGKRRYWVLRCLYDF